MGAGKLRRSAKWRKYRLMYNAAYVGSYIKPFPPRAESQRSPPWQRDGIRQQLRNRCEGIRHVPLGELRSSALTGMRSPAAGLASSLLRISTIPIATCCTCKPKRALEAKCSK